MKYIFALAGLLFGFSVSAGTCAQFWADSGVPIDENLACLSYAQPTQNADGSPLTDLAGYKLSWGIASGVYDQSQEITDIDQLTYDLTLQIPTAPEGVEYFFTIQAFDSSGNYSDHSREVSKVLRFVDTMAPDKMLPLKIEMRIRFTVPGGELVYP